MLNKKYKTLIRAIIKLIKSLNITEENFDLGAINLDVFGFTNNYVEGAYEIKY